MCKSKSRKDGLRQALKALKARIRHERSRIHDRRSRPPQKLQEDFHALMRGQHAQDLRSHAEKGAFTEGDLVSWLDVALAIEKFVLSEFRFQVFDHTIRNRRLALAKMDHRAYARRVFDRVER